MAVVGCYTLDLYCDAGGDMFGGTCPHRGFAGNAQFTGNTERECLAQARSKGWSFKRRVTLTYCPKCTKDGNT